MHLSRTERCGAGRRRYNFMPLARGTAAVGYLTLLAVFLAADMPIAAHIPKARRRLQSTCPQLETLYGGYCCRVRGCARWPAAG